MLSTGGRRQSEQVNNSSKSGPKYAQIHKNDLKVYPHYKAVSIRIDSDSDQTIIQATSRTSALEQYQAGSSQLLASITSCDVSDSLLKAKETSLVTYQHTCFISSTH